MSITIGSALRAIGKRRAVWLDQTTGFERSGEFHPEFDDPYRRYGNPDELRVKDWPARNKVGAHATGLNSRVTPELAAKVLGRLTGEEVSLDPAHDMTDLDFVDGATATIVAEAVKQGLLKEEAPWTAPAPPPTVPPLPAVIPDGVDLLKVVAAAVSRIEARLASNKVALDLIATYEAGIGTRPAPELRAFLGELRRLLA